MGKQIPIIDKPRIWMLDLWCIVPYYDAYLCEALLKLNIPVTLISTTYYLDRQCFSRHQVNHDPGLLDLVGRFNLPRRFRRLLKAFETSINTIAIILRALWSRPDLVHIQYLPLLKWDFPIDLWCIRFLNWLGIPVVYTIHDLLPHDTGQKHRAIFHRLYHSVQGLICHSEETGHRLQQEFGVTPDEVFVIPHGPFFKDSSGLESEPLRDKLLHGQRLVLWQGIIFPYKGIEFLLSSWQIVQAKKVKAKLVIAGTGEEALLGRIRAIVEESGLGQSVHLDFRFLPLPELLQLYALADVVIYPYRAITSSGALHTGLSQGKAIIATRLPAFTEILKDNKTALLVDYGDVNALAMAIIRLIESPVQRKELEKAVRQEFQSKTWDSIAHSTEQCYRTVRARWLGQ